MDDQEKKDVVLSSIIQVLPSIVPSSIIQPSPSIVLSSIIQSSLSIVPSSIIQPSPSNVPSSAIQPSPSIVPSLIVSASVSPYINSPQAQSQDGNTSMSIMTSLLEENETYTVEVSARNVFGKTGSARKNFLLLKTCYPSS